MGVLAGNCFGNTMPCSAAFRKTERIRAYVYCMNGPVFPLKSIDSFGLKVIFLRGSTFKMKYFREPNPTMREILAASSGVISSSLPSSCEIS